MPAMLVARGNEMKQAGKQLIIKKASRPRGN
jgi:hypothetical protein